LPVAPATRRKESIMRAGRRMAARSFCHEAYVRSQSLLGRFYQEGPRTIRATRELVRAYVGTEADFL
jgi:hypothetical protein